MRRWRVWYLLVSALAAAPVVAEPTERPVIEVTGEASAQLQPDYTQWVVEIEIADQLADTMLEVEAEILEVVLDIADDADVVDADLQVGRPRLSQDIGQPHKWLKDADSIAHTVRRRIEFKLRDLDAVTEVFLELGKLGVDYTYTYKSSKYEQTLRQVRLDALRDAKARAKEQAAVLDQAIGPATRVHVSQDRLDHASGGFFGLTDALRHGREDQQHAADEAGPDGLIHLRAFADVDFELKP